MSIINNDTPNIEKLLSHVASLKYAKDENELTDTIRKALAEHYKVKVRLQNQIERLTDVKLFHVEDESQLHDETIAELRAQLAAATEERDKLLDVQKRHAEKLADVMAALKRLLATMQHPELIAAIDAAIDAAQNEDPFPDIDKITDATIDQARAAAQGGKEMERPITAAEHVRQEAEREQEERDRRYWKREKEDDF